ERARHYAGEQINDALDVHHRRVMLYAEEAKTHHKEQRVTRHPNQCWTNPVSGLSKPIDALFQPVLRNLSIDERVSIDARGMCDEPQPQSEAQRQRERRP